MSRQSELDHAFASLARKKTALEKQMKDLKEYEKALKEEQQAIWDESNMTFFDVWNEENKEDEKEEVRLAAVGKA